MGLFKRKEKDRFGQILIAKGLVTAKDIEEALRLQKEMRETKKIHKAIGAILAEKGVIGPEDIDSALEEQKNREGFIFKGLVYSIFNAK